MTIPKTLAAEPSSQYATAFELVTGKDEAEGAAEDVADSLAAALMLRPRAPRGDAVVDTALELCALDWRKAFKKGVCRVDLNV
jgi:hypothetical protein